MSRGSSYYFVFTIMSLYSTLEEMRRGGGFKGSREAEGQTVASVCVSVCALPPTLQRSCQIESASLLPLMCRCWPTRLLLHLKATDRETDSGHREREREGDGGLNKSKTKDGLNEGRAAKRKGRLSAKKEKRRKKSAHLAFFIFLRRGVIACHISHREAINCSSLCSDQSNSHSFTPHASRGMRVCVPRSESVCIVYYVMTSSLV